MASEPNVRVLNNEKVSVKCNVSAQDLAKKLQKTMLCIKGECMEESTRGIDYDKLKKSKAFEDYKAEARMLHNVKLDSLTEMERKAFFINLYNALTIHGLAENDVLPDTVLDIQQFWKTTAYRIGDYVFSLDDIEHGILRGNQAHPASTSPQFRDKDPRQKYIVKRDPRIHFALVCGAVSCPAINVYTADNLDKALDAATRNFCAQEVCLFTETNEIWLSKIFLWYREDFGQSEIELIQWTFPYLEKDIQDRGHVLLFKLQNLGQVDIKYNEYDWRLNKLGVRPIFL